MRTIDQHRVMAQWSAHPDIRITVQQGTGLRKDYIIAATDGRVNWAAGTGEWPVHELVPARKKTRRSTKA